MDGRRVLRAAVRDADVVVVDSLASNTLGPLLTARRRPLPPLVGSIHQRLGGSDHGRAAPTPQARSDRLTWRACAAVVVPSERLAADLRAAGMAHPAVHVVPPGHDLPAAHAGDRRSATLGPAAAPPCCASPTGSRARASSPCSTRSPASPPMPSPCTSSATRPSTAATAGRSSIASRGRTCATASSATASSAPERIGALYDAADVFALPSTEEPYGIVYGEAMAAGLPVVGWAAGQPAGARSTTASRAARCPSTTSPRSTDALRELADDELTRKRLGAAAIERARRPADVGRHRPPVLRRLPIRRPGASCGSTSLTDQVPVGSPTRLDNLAYHPARCCRVPA